MKRNLSNAIRLKLVIAGLGALLGAVPLNAADEAGPKAGETNALAKASANTPPAGATNSVPAAEASAAPTSLDYSAFRVIADRNIFNSGRSSRTARNGERPRQVQVDTFSVVGTLSYAKGDVAFFDGSSALYRRPLKVGESIAGHKVLAITAEEVQLESDGKKVTLKVGGQMRREDEGPWEMASAGVSHNFVSSAAGPGSSSSGSSDSSSGGEVSDALKRLLQKREQELKNENQ